MRLSHIIKSLSTTAERSGPDPDIVGIACNSRRVRQGFIFVAIPGTVANGWDFVEDAIKRGACAILSEHPPRRLDGIAQITVNDAHTAYAEMAAAFNGGPAEKLRVIGVTGTNGKTTTAYMIRDVLRAAGMDPGLLGTVAYELGERCIPAGRTTPDAGTIQSLLRQMVDIGCKSAVMEVSSHALVQKRTAAISFDVAIFTNLTRDHLDYHGTMEAYYEAKASLFRSLSPTAIAIINTDDAWGRKLQQEGLPGQVLTYGIADGADVSAESVEVSAKGCRFVARTPWGDERVELQLLGRHNVSNALACIASCCAQVVELPAACKALSQLATVRGRLEPVRGKQRFCVFVDYAHTDDALSHALSTVREFTAGRVIVVFGCGGDRDKSKRPAMGQVAAALADVAVVTSDNPRSEAPAAIIADVLTGMDDAKARVEMVEDRSAAIGRAIDLAEAGDTVLIAGKGHETHQECGSHTVAFDDHEVARKALGEQ